MFWSLITNCHYIKVQSSCNTETLSLLTVFYVGQIHFMSCLQKSGGAQNSNLRNQNDPDQIWQLRDTSQREAIRQWSLWRLSSNNTVHCPSLSRSDFISQHQFHQYSVSSNERKNQLLNSAFQMYLNANYFKTNSQSELTEIFCFGKIMSKIM